MNWIDATNNYFNHHWVIYSLTMFAIILVGLGVLFGWSRFRFRFFPRMCQGRDGTGVVTIKFECGDFYRYCYWCRGEGKV